MIIKIEDTGLVNYNFTATDVINRFKTYSSLTSSEADLESKKYGEFRLDSPITLKVLNKNKGISTNNQEIPSFDGTSSNSYKISTSPIKLTLTVRLEKPLIYSTTDYKDLTDIKQFNFLPITQGHKDIYVIPEQTDDDKLLSLYYDMYNFGKTDAGSPSLSGTDKLHLNVKVNAISENESVNTLSYNISMTLLYNL
ncbi:MAG: hypothetical protein EOL97_09595 [Spirochaetia bacterium]|nr:hypothetical protein [Spirochaetia bacterium]